MRKLIKLILLILLAMVSAGCVGAQETDQVAYILTVGLDKAQEEGKLEITYQVAVPKALAGGEGVKGGGGGGEQTYNISITAVSIAESLNQLNSILSRSPNLSHNKAFIIGEKLARDGLQDVIAPLMRYREWRGTMFIFVVREDTAKNLMQKNKPKLESLSRYYESMFETGNYSGYYIVPNLHKFYIRLKDGSAAPYAALCGINAVQGGMPTEGKSPPGKTAEYEAGFLPRDVTNTNLVSIMGTALFKGDKMVGTLTNEETRMLSMIAGDFQHGFLTVDDPLLPEKGINVALRLGRGTKLTVDFINGQPVFGVDVLLEGEITSIPSGINYEQDQYYQLLEEQVSMVIRQDMLKMIRKTQQLGCDVAGFGYVARTQWRTYDQYRNVNWTRLYSEADVNVKVTTRLRRTGLMWQTSPIVDHTRQGGAP